MTMYSYFFLIFLFNFFFYTLNSYNWELSIVNVSYAHFWVIIHLYAGIREEIIIAGFHFLTTKKETWLNFIDKLSVIDSVKKITIFCIIKNNIWIKQIKRRLCSFLSYHPSICRDTRASEKISCTNPPWERAVCCEIG